MSLPKDCFTATKYANNEAANLISLGRYGEAHRLLKSMVQALMPYLPLLDEPNEEFVKVGPLPSTGTAFNSWR